MHTPPRPQAHDRQLGPYVFKGHWAQLVPLAKVPLEHAETHEVVDGSSSSGDTHVVQAVDEPVQVAQLTEHVVHVMVASANVPDGQAATQTPALKYGTADVALHVVHAAGPAA